VERGKENWEIKTGGGSGVGFFLKLGSADISRFAPVFNPLYHPPTCRRYVDKDELIDVYGKSPCSTARAYALLGHTILHSTFPLFYPLSSPLFIGAPVRKSRALSATEPSPYCILTAPLAFLKPHGQAPLQRNSLTSM